MMVSRRNSEATGFCTNFFHHESHMTPPGSNSGLRGEKAAPTLLSYGMAFYIISGETEYTLKEIMPTLK
jgi:hypothetical protein